MEGDLVNVAINVLRIFVRGIVRGNNLTFHLDELHTELCRSMCKTKKKDRDKLRGRLLAVLNALTAKNVLVLNYDNWTARNAPQIKSKDKKKVYGLTNSAALFLEEQKNNDFALESADCIKNVLAHFDVISAPEIPVTTAAEIAEPPAEVTAPETINETEREAMPLIINTAGEPYEHLTIKDFSRLTEDQRAAILIGVLESNTKDELVARVKGDSAKWSTDSTPADLLGGLAEFYGGTMTYETVNKVASAAKLGWPDTKRPRYQACRDYLAGLNLVRPAETRSDSKSETGLRGHGLTLTVLGFVVAQNFKDERPAQERAGVIRYPYARSKVGPMTKNKKEKKAMSAISIDNPQIKAIVAQLVKEQVAAALGQSSVAADAAVTVTRIKRLPRYETIGALVKSTISGFCSALVGLNKPGDTPKTADINSTDIDSVFCAITEIERRLQAMKIYVGNCIASGTELDENKINDYNALISLQCETLERDKELAVIVDLDTPKLPGSKRSLTGPFVIDHSAMTDQLV